MSIQKIFKKSLLIGIHPELSEGKKLSIQIATLDAYWSILTISFYVVMGLILGPHPLLYLHILSLGGVFLGIWLLYKRHYDTARFCIHFICLLAVFLTADAYGPNSGMENYYFTSIAIPFVTFSIDERWKGNIQIAMASFVLLFQQLIGTGHFMPSMEIVPEDKLISILIVISYFVLIFGVVRREVKAALAEVDKRQRELIHASNLSVAGKMSNDIAHEINNPLQALSLSVAILREKIQEDVPQLEVIEKRLTKMEEIISSIGSVVHDLREESEVKFGQPIETFQFIHVLDRVLHKTGERLSFHGASLSISGDTSRKVKGHSIQIFDILSKLLHDASEAIKNQSEKWIRIEVEEKNTFLQISVSNPGKDRAANLPCQVVREMIESNNGSLYSDDTAPHSRAILLLPLG